MSVAVLVLINVVVLVAVTAAGLGLCYRELRLVRRGLAALDEAEGRRAATIVGSVQAVREPLDAIRVGVEGRSSEPRARRDDPWPRSGREDMTGLRRDLPRAIDDGDSDGETKLMRQPTLEELRATGAVPDGGDRGRAPRRSERG